MISRLSISRDWSFRFPRCGKNKTALPTALAKGPKLVIQQSSPLFLRPARFRGLLPGPIREDPVVISPPSNYRVPSGGGFRFVATREVQDDDAPSSQPSRLSSALRLVTKFGSGLQSSIPSAMPTGRDATDLPFRFCAWFETAIVAGIRHAGGARRREPRGKVPPVTILTYMFGLDDRLGAAASSWSIINS